MSTHPLRFAPYRWLLLGSTTNALGNGVAPVALAFAVLDLGGDAGDLGLVVASLALAEVSAVLAGGVLGDRLPRRLMMTVAMAGAALAEGVAAASLLGGWSSLLLLGCTAFCIGIMGALGGPSSQAITRQTVPEAELRRAVVFRRLSQNAAIIVGSGLGGLFVAFHGSGWALAVNAATFAVASVAYTQIRVPHETPEVDVEAARSPLADLGEGFAEVMRHTWLWLLILQALLYHLFYGGAQGVLGPIVVEDTISRAAWGYALAAMMAGFMAGGVVTLRWKPRRPLHVGVWFLALTAAFPVAMAVSDSLVVLLVGAFVHGFGLEIFSVGWDLSIQENIAPDKLARVYSFDLVGSFVARPVGLALTGPVAGLMGNRLWLLVVGGVIVASVLAALTNRDVRTLERRPPAPAQKAI